MKYPAWLLPVVAVTLTLFLRASPAAPATNRSSDSAALARRILTDTNLPIVLEKARSLLKSGLTAGGGYGEVWIRDCNTFIEVALEVNEPATIREALLVFFKFQGSDGNIVDGYTPRSRANISYKYRHSDLAPELLAHKNTVETDQEASLVQATYRYVQRTGDQAFLQEVVAGRSVIDRLGLALNYVCTERFDTNHGLIWGATTVDWGDVQPEHPWGVELDENSHRALDIYDNALVIGAIGNYLELLGPRAPQARKWRQIRAGLQRNVRKHLWDARRRKFIPHVYLGSSPFPKDLDEAAIYYHGGTAVAIEAGLLSEREITFSLAQMRSNVVAAGAASIGLTVYPPYPQGTFQNSGMGPYHYQNGGDWCWFGGRMIQELIRHGLVADAYLELKPMTDRVVRVGDFHEWWSRDNQPQGSGQYRGSAGVLGKAIEMLLDWAKAHENPGNERPHASTTKSGT